MLPKIVYLSIQKLTFAVLIDPVLLPLFYFYLFIYLFIYLKKKHLL